MSREDGEQGRAHNPIDIVQEEMRIDDRGQLSLGEKVVLGVNYTIFGFFYGALYFLTSVAGLLRLIDNKPTALTFGIIAGLLDGVANGVLAPQATRILFQKRPDVWFLTAGILMLFGDIASMPFVEALLQGNTEIKNKIGMPLDAIDKEIGNPAFLVTSIIFSTGAVSVFSGLFALLMWKCMKKERYQLDVEEQYLRDQRSEQEYDQHDPDLFLAKKFSKKRVFWMCFSIIPAVGLNYSFANEIPKMLDQKGQIALMRWSLVFLDHVGLTNFAKTDLGAKVVSCATNVPFAFMFMSTAFRVLPRDFVFAGSALKAGQFGKAGVVAAYFVLIALTCATAVFQAIKAGAGLGWVLTAFGGAALANFSGPRPGFYNRVMPFLLKRLCRLSDPTAYMADFPAVREQKKMLERLSHLKLRREALKEQSVLQTSGSTIWQAPPAPAGEASESDLLLPQVERGVVPNCA